MIIFLALLHAVPVFLVAVITNNRTAIVLSAVVMAGIGIATGAGRYMFIDTLAVATVAYFFYNRIAQDHPSNQATKQAGRLVDIIKAIFLGVVSCASVLFLLFFAIIYCNNNIGDCAEKNRQPGVTFAECSDPANKKS